jgi:hypothetical protein
MLCCMQVALLCRRHCVTLLLCGRHCVALLLCRRHCVTGAVMQLMPAQMHCSRAVLLAQHATPAPAAGPSLLQLLRYYCYITHSNCCLVSSTDGLHCCVWCSRGLCRPILGGPLIRAAAVSWQGALGLLQLGAA